MMNSINRFILTSIFILACLSGHTGMKIIFSHQQLSDEDPVWIQKGNKWILCDQNHKPLNNLLYEKHGDWSLNRTWIALNQKYGFIDKNGHEIIPAIYDNMMIHFDDNGFFAQQNGKWGFVNWQGEIVIPFQYDFISRIYDNGLVAVNAGGKKVKEDGTIDGGKWGYINTKGQILTPLLYDYVSSNWENGIVWVNQGGKMNITDGSISGGKFGLIDSTGTEIVPLLFKGNKSARAAYQKGIGNLFEIGDIIPDKIWNY